MNKRVEYIDTFVELFKALMLAIGITYAIPSVSLPRAFFLVLSFKVWFD